MADITIRRAANDEAETIAQFNIAMAKETEDKTLDADTVLAGTKSLFAKPEFGFYVVAQVDTQVVGSLMITYEWSDWRDGLFWWVQSVYVLPEFRRQGVFRALYEYVSNEAQNADDVSGLRLYVENENLNAQKTYRDMGMAECDYKMFEQMF